MKALATSESDQVARSLWPAVTIDVAWTLLQAGVRPAGAALREAREHVLCTVSGVEDVDMRVVGEATREYLDRVTRRRYLRREVEACPVQVLPEWRDRVVEACDDVADAVFHLAYGDGMPLEAVARATRHDVAVLSGARAGLRQALRAVLDAEGVTDAQVAGVAGLDAVLSALAALPAWDCDGGQALLTPEGRRHARTCPRCTRGLRLIRSGRLSPLELSPPEFESVLPSGRVNVLALHLHPEARQHRKELVQLLGDGAYRADDDTVLVDLDRVANVAEVLSALAEEGRPPRDQVRGVRTRGRGRWTGHVLIGAVGREVVQTVRSQAWGEVDGIGPLPPALPAPPSSVRHWMGAVLATLLTAMVGLAVFRDEERRPAFPLEASFEALEDGVAVRFDVDDGAWVAIVAQGPAGAYEVWQASDAAAKGAIGTGEGDYRVVAPGASRLLVASAPAPVEGMAHLVAQAARSTTPLEDLELRLRAVAEADVALQGPR